MIAKKPCKNDATFSFTGKESSPLGLGYSASAEQVGSMMTGRDQTMWMVGIKNGVKVWNRVPTEIAAAAAPLEKDEPVLGETNKEAPDKEEPPAVKKKTVTRKKKDVAEKAPEAVIAPEVDEPKVTPAVVDTSSEGEDKKPKKKIVKKKKAPDAVVPEAETESNDEEGRSDTASTKEVADVAKPKRKPSTFNIFMSYRMKVIAQEDPTLSHKEKFGKAAAEWRTMDDDAKKSALEKAMTGAV